VDGANSSEATYGKRKPHTEDILHLSQPAKRVNNKKRAEEAGYTPDYKAAFQQISNSSFPAVTIFFQFLKVYKIKN
jgi:hypothetical protein